jgi:hypothetical protein
MVWLKNVFVRIFFASHFDQLAIIFLRMSRNQFRVTWKGNSESWIYDPLHLSLSFMRFGDVERNKGVASFAALD